VLSASTSGTSPSTAQDLDEALQFGVATDERVDAPVLGLEVEIGGVLFQRALGAVLFRVAVHVGGHGHAVVIVAGILGDAVGDVVDHVQAGDVLFVEEIHRLGVLFPEDGHQQVGGAHLALVQG